MMQNAHLVTTGYNYIGAQADINVWNPKVELPDDFTTAQMWLKAGNGPNYFESVESGWAVSTHNITKFKLINHTYIPSYFLISYICDWCKMLKYEYT